MKRRVSRQSKCSKKLQIWRESLRILTEGPLNRVVGGSSVDSCTTKYVINHASADSCGF